MHEEAEVDDDDDGDVSGDNDNDSDNDDDNDENVKPALHKSLCMRKFDPSAQEKGLHRPSTQNDLLDHYGFNEDHIDDDGEATRNQ